MVIKTTSKINVKQLFKSGAVPLYHSLVTSLQWNIDHISIVSLLGQEVGKEVERGGVCSSPDSFSP